MVSGQAYRACSVPGAWNSRCWGPISRALRTAGILTQPKRSEKGIASRWRPWADNEQVRNRKASRSLRVCGMECQKWISGKTFFLKYNCKNSFLYSSQNNPLKSQRKAWTGLWEGSWEPGFWLLASCWYPGSAGASHWKFQGLNFFV